MYPKLKQYRIIANLSQIELAKKAGLSKQYYCQLENGTRGNRWSLENAKNIAFALADELKKSRNKVFCDIFLS